MDAKSEAPLAGNYTLTVLFVLLALCPDLFLSTGMTVNQREISAALGTSPVVLGLGETFSNAGWAFGAVLAADLALRFSGWKLNVAYEVVFIVGSILGAVAPSAGFVVAGRILQGIATGMLLISTLPPIIRGFPAERLGFTVAVTDIGLFGAITAGTVVGGFVAETGTWRWFFAVAGVLGLCALLLAIFVVRRQGGYNPGFPVDTLAIVLAAAGAGLAFYGVGRLNGASTSWTDPLVWVPTALGAICTVALIVYQYVRENALMPVRPIATTYPIIGITAGVLGGAAYTGLNGLLLIVVQSVLKYSPVGIALVFWPGIAASLVAAIVFGRFFGTRYLLLLPLLGIASLLVGAWLMTTITTNLSSGELLWINGLLGFGAGITVAPALFMAGLSVKPTLVGRAFALVEMLRLAGAFAIVPAFLYFATSLGSRPSEVMLGVHLVTWVILIGLGIIIVICSVIFVVGGARIHVPDLHAYLEGGEPALESPGLARGEDRPAVSDSLSAAARSTFLLDETVHDGHDAHSEPSNREQSESQTH